MISQGDSDCCSAMLGCRRRPWGKVLDWPHVTLHLPLDDPLGVTSLTGAESSGFSPGWGRQWGWQGMRRAGRGWILVGTACAKI